jgi:hypothetical protein
MLSNKFVFVCSAPSPVRVNFVNICDQEGQMPHSPYPWQEHCACFLQETDHIEALRLLELAIGAIERRYAEWPASPGTGEEVAAIRAAISDLRQGLWRLRSDDASKGAA